MSNESQIMSGVSAMVDFIKTKTIANLVEANNRKMIEVNETTLKAITNLVESSIESAFVVSSSEVINKIK